MAVTLPHTSSFHSCSLLCGSDAAFNTGVKTNDGNMLYFHSKVPVVEKDLIYFSLYFLVAFSK